MARPVSIIQQEIRELSLAEKEAERQGQEIDSGAVQCIPAQEIFTKIDRILGR